MTIDVLDVTVETDTISACETVWDAEAVAVGAEGSTRRRLRGDTCPSDVGGSGGTAFEARELTLPAAGPLADLSGSESK